MTSSPTHLNQELDCFSIEEFCRRHGISRGTFFNLRATGAGPREKRVMSRVLISREAAAEWRTGSGAQLDSTMKPAVGVVR
jgi:hypothetical protein